MAISDSAVIEVRSTGNDANGGVFNPTTSGTDYSQQNAAALTLADVVSNNTTTITSATGGFTVAHIGNGINIGGNLYEIVSRTSASSIVVDRAVPTGTAQAARIGGALASPGFVSSQAGNVTSGIKCWIRYGSYTMSASASVSAGTVNVTGNGIRFEGYDVARGDRARKPVFTATAAGVTMFTCGAGVNFVQFANLRADGANLANVTGFNCQTRSNIIDCDALNCVTGVSSRAFRCYAENCSTAFSNSTQLCVANNCGLGYLNNFHSFSIATNCSTGFRGNSGSLLQLMNCVAAGGTNGVNATNAGLVMQNCVVIGTSSKGISDTSPNAIYSKVATYSTSGGNDIATIALTADPFANSTATVTSLETTWANFTPNSVSGGGTLLRGTGIPTNLDIGAVQHADSGSGGASSSTGSIFGSSIICAGGRTT